jgi:hypothetical protein
MTATCGPSRHQLDNPDAPALVGRRAAMTRRKCPARPVIGKPGASRINRAGHEEGKAHANIAAHKGEGG